jgi:AraC-like DNA-binding protein
MHQPVDILQIAHKQPFLAQDLILMQDVERHVPGSVKYQIKRYKKNEQWNIEDTGMLVYHINPNDPQENYLEIKFCVSGNVYCKEKKAECNFCRLSDSKTCAEKVNSLDILSFTFQPHYLIPFVKGRKPKNITDEVLAFVHTSSFSKILPICAKTRMAVEGLLNHNYTDTFENIFINAQTQILLLYSLECMLGERETAFSCKFLANEADREKIVKAREVLLQHIGEPLTIKALSRKVAINECYLKKGFKELFGTTIFDFYQSQRMEHAKYLLYEKGLSVTEVSGLLGYSSISHFSTAFKKHTGIKPCELLLH